MNLKPTLIIKHVFACFLLISNAALYAQRMEHLPGTNLENLRQIATQEEEKFKAEKAGAIEKAGILGIPVRYSDDKGTYELIRFESGTPVYYMTNNSGAAITTRANRVHPGGGLGLNLTGAGMNIHEWDGGAVRTTHQELTGRVIQVDGASALSDHATHVAGTLMASGVQPNARGMAYQANLRSYDWNSDISEMATAASSGALVSNHSYGTITGWAFGDWATGTTNEWHWWGDPSISPTTDWRFGFYDNTARIWDDIAFNAPFYLIVKAAGNDRGDSFSGTHKVWNGSAWVSSSASREADGGASGYDCISTFATAKNILTVGAVNGVASYVDPSSVTMSSFSGWGPTDDGRIKPDVVGKGVSVFSPYSGSDIQYSTINGTSMASPNVAGSLLLLQQHHFNLKGSYMRSATLKALAVHTADEAGAAPGPDYIYGWGLLNIERAAQTLTNTSNNQVVETTLNNGNTYTLPFTSSGLNNTKVTVCWTDPFGSVSSSSLNPAALRLVNDLDVRIVSVGGPAATYFPYILNPASPAAAATTGDNFRDNVEVLFPGILPAGNYEVRVTHKGTLTGGVQAFSLILSQSAVPYCTSSATSSIDSKIDSVRFGAIISGSPSSNCETYTDNTSLSANLVRGGSYPIFVRSSTCGGNFSKYLKVFIDFNQNQSFDDPGEMVFESSVAAAPVTVSGSVSIPAGASLGSTRMRVVLKEGGTTANTASCGAYDWGETEDYTVNIQSASSPPAANFSASLTTIAAGNAVSFTDLSSNAPTSWAWTFTGGTPSSSSVQNPAGIVYNTPGCYAVTLVATNGFGSSAPETKTCYINVSTPSYCPVTHNPNGTTDGDFINGVILGSINNVNTGSTSGPFYTDYTSLSTNLTIGQPYAIQVSNGSWATNYIAAWIDYNGDFDFDDPGEKLGEVQTTATFQYQTINFTVPPGTSAGVKRMRVRLAYNSPNMDPCLNYDYGETEDYSVNIQPLYCVPVMVNSYDSEHITNVTMGSINNNSGAATTSSSPPIPAYQDFSNLVAEFVRGGNISFSVTGVTPYTFQYGLKIFIDWNQNGNLEDIGETYTFGPVNGSGGFANFSGTIPIGILQDTGLYRVRVLYYYFPSSSSSCSVGWGEFEDYTLRVTSPPLPTATLTRLAPTGNICQGTMANFRLTLTGTQPWAVEIDSSGGTILFNGITSSPFDFSRLHSQSGTFNYFVRNVSDGTLQTNNTSGTTIVVNVDALPTASDAGADQNVCAATATLNGNLPTVGTGVWSSLGAASVTAPANRLSGVTGLASGNNLFVWTISNGTCAPSRDTVNIIRDALPTASDAGADQNVCAITTATLDGNPALVGSGIWSSIGTATVNNPSNNTSGVSNLVVGANRFVWTISNGVCPPSRDTVNIRRYFTTSGANAGPDQNVCTTTASLSGNNPTYGTGQWSSLGPASINNPANRNSGVTGLVTGDNLFVWTITNGVCLVRRDTVNIIRDVVPTTSDAGSEQTLCATTTTLNGNDPSIGTGLWTSLGAASVTTPANRLSGVTGLAVGNNLFVWTISNGTCAPSRDTVNIIRDAVPTISNAGVDQELCAATATLNGNLPTVGTGVWSSLGAASVTTPANRLSGVTGLVIGNNFFVWTISNGTCTPSRDTVNIIRDALPTASDAGADQNVCAATATLNGNLPTVGTGVWSSLGAASVTTPANRLSGVTGLVIGNNFFVWTISNGTCTPSRDTVNIIRDALPTASDAGADQNVCAATATLNGNLPTVGTGVWSSLGAASVTTPANRLSGVTGLVIGNNFFVWTISNGTCAPSRDTVNIIRDALPTASDAGADQNVCAATATLNGNLPTVGTGVWSSLGAASVTTPANRLSGVTGLAAGNNLFVWTISNGTCAPSRDTVNIIRDALPTASNAGTDQTVCAATAALDGNNPTIGIGLWSSLGAASVTTPANRLSGVTGLVIGNNFFVWTISNGTCAPSRDTVNIVRNTPPNPAFSGLASTYCVSSDTASPIPVTPGGIFTGPGMVGGLFNTSIAGVGTHTITYVVGTAGCIDSSSQTVTVTPVNNANAGSNQTICAGNTVTLNGSLSQGGTGQWSTSGTGTFSPSNTALNASYTPSAADIAVGTVNLTLAPTGVCLGISSTLTITINAGPLASAGNNLTLCNYTTLFPITGTVTGATGGTWTTTGTGVFSPSSNLLSTSYVPSVTDKTGTIFLILTSTGNGNCPASVDTISVTFIADPFASTIASASDTVVCENSSISLNVAGMPTGSITSFQQISPSPINLGGGLNVTSQAVTLAAAGNYLFTVTMTQSDNNCQKSELMQVLVNVCTGLDIAESFIITESIYPNPTTGLLHVQLTLGNERSVVMELVTLEGKQLSFNEIRTPTIMIDEVLDMSHLAQGTYFLKLSSGDGLKIYKIVRH